MKRNNNRKAPFAFPAVMLALVLALSLAGCSSSGGSKEEQSETAAASSAVSEAVSESKEAEAVSEASSADETITIVDLAGRTVTFDHPVTKFIDQGSGSGGAFFTAAAILGDDLCDYLVGWDNGIVKWRTDFYNHFVVEMPELANVSMVGGITGDDFDLEAVLVSGAECMFMPQGTFKSVEDTVAKKLEEAGIQIVVLNFQAQTYETHMQCIDIIGKVLGREEKAQEIMDFYTEAVKGIYDKVDDLLAANDGVRPVVYGEYGKNDDGPLVSYATSWTNQVQWGGIIWSLGGTSLAGDTGADGNNPKVDPEYVLSSDPDMIFISAVSPSSPEESVSVGGSIYVGFDVTPEAIEANRQLYLQRPGWSELKAVKEGRVYVLPHPIHREVFDASSIQAMAKLLWPDEFGDLEPVKTFEAFWDKFMPFTLTGTWYCEN